MVPEPVHQQGQREHVAGTAQEGEDHAPDDEARVDAVAEAEDGQAEVGEDARLGDEGHRAEQELHGYLGHGRQVEVGVVGHDDAAEEYGHDPCEQEKRTAIFFIKMTEMRHAHCLIK